MRERIIAFLATEGFDTVAFPSGIPAISGAGPDRVVVEASRDGVRHKGSVTIEGGQPAECRLLPNHAMFP